MQWEGDSSSGVFGRVNALRAAVVLVVLVQRRRGGGKASGKGGSGRSEGVKGGTRGPVHANDLVSMTPFRERIGFESDGC